MSDIAPCGSVCAASELLTSVVDGGNVDNDGSGEVIATVDEDNKVVVINLVDSVASVRETVVSVATDPVDPAMVVTGASVVVVVVLSSH
mmetsp:Transcript_813/g.1578  ORF Transcript_813/g.1578 Transcript_813/m.1578 type:complete len:89 (-) Transcript_813:199-465(-)